MNTTTWRVELYDGSQRPSAHPYKTAECQTESDARRTAARLLGHSTLRGASSWDRYQGGTVYQFGPRTEDSGYDYAVILEPGETDPRHEALADYDCPA